MPKHLLPVWGFIFLNLLHTCYAQFTYISPVPDSKMHNKETGIILRTGEYVDAASLRPDLFSISGSLSGEHLVKAKLASDNKSILIQPQPIFSPGETVTVIVKDGIMNGDESIVHGTTFHFQISNTQITGQTTGMESDENNGGLRQVCDHLPAFTITSTPGAYYDEPVFYRNWVAPPVVSDCWMTTIISSEGDSIYSHYDNDIGFEFKLNDNGYLTCHDGLDNCFDMFDSSYNLVKKLYMGNGYVGNKHEFRIYPDGTRFMICFDVQAVDMTAYGGQPDAQVTGLVIQQLDSNDNVLFEWRSWDHFLYTDAANDILLTTNSIDYVHGNSLELDTDGNLLLSCRNFDEITKIDLSTGNIIWRMGSENNEFTFINDPDGPKPFSHQHHFRRLPNGHFTMFDNGNFQNPQQSTAKEFVLDEVNKTATLVWSYVHPQVNGYNVFGSALGSVQLLPNGNRFIDWGNISSSVAFADIPNFTEVDSNGNIVWEFRFVDSTYFSYRAFKHPWDRCNLFITDSLIADSITATSADLYWNNNTKFSGFALEYKECDSSSWIVIPLDTNFYHLDGLQLNTCYDWRVKSICEMYNDSFYTAPNQFATLNPTSAFDPGFDQLNFTLFPNPAADEVGINFFSELNVTAEATIFDLSGAALIHKIFSAQKGMNKSRINLKFLSVGVYTVQLKLSTGIRFRRLIVQ